MARSAPSDRSWLEGWEPREPAGAPTGRGRREAERLLAYWEEKLRELGGVVTIAGLDLAAADSRDWSNRFLISVDPVVERSALLLYGPKFAQLFGLPAEPRTDLPMMRQLPRRYVDLFLRGCAEAQREMGPVRLEGEIERADGRIEQYRAIFIPVGVKPGSLTCFAFGAFNSRVIEPG
jgi:PAS domain-containing protein